MISVVIPASGMGIRMGASKPKQFMQLDGMDILQRTISVFEQMDIVDTIVVAVQPCYMQTIANYGFAKLQIVQGGESRAASVYSALLALPQNTDVVLIHDGVRPFVTLQTVRDVTDAVKKYGAAIACTPVTNTIKQTKNGNCIESTPDRHNLWNALTPQGFTYNLILQAYKQGATDNILHTVTDDSTLVERLDVPVFVVPSCSRNIKITTAEDLQLAKLLLNEGTACEK